MNNVGKGGKDIVTPSPIVSVEVKNDVKARDTSQHECMSYPEGTLLVGVKWPSHDGPTGVLGKDENIPSVMSPVRTSNI